MVVVYVEDDIVSSNNIWYLMYLTICFGYVDHVQQ